MIIAYDGKRAVQNLTGLGNYSRLIIESVAREFPSHSLSVYAPSPRKNPRLDHILSMPNVSMRFPLKGETPLGRSMWRTFGIPAALKADRVSIFHGLSNELPLNISRSGIPSVLTMHDVIYRTMPECYRLPDRLLYDFKYGASCRAASHIIAISECTKRDIMRFYHIPEQKISVIYQGCDNIFHSEPSPRSLAEARKTYDLPERFLLQVGSIERRKNAELSVRALSAVNSDLPLILIGRATPYLREIEELASTLGVRGRLRVLHDVPFPHLPLLYRLATAALYPSHYEGFGIPVLEAITCGTPCIAATGSCLEEAGGEAAIYVTPRDPRAMARAIDSILSGDPGVISRIEKGRRHAARFDNAEIASRVMEIYLRVAK